MGRTELQEIIAAFEDDFSSIHAVLDDAALTASEKLDAIAEIVEGDDDKTLED